MGGGAGLWRGVSEQHRRTNGATQATTTVSARQEGKESMVPEGGSRSGQGSPCGLDVWVERDDAHLDGYQI